MRPGHGVRSRCVFKGRNGSRALAPCLQFLIFAGRGIHRLVPHNGPSSVCFWRPSEQRQEYLANALTAQVLGTLGFWSIYKRSRPSGPYIVLKMEGRYFLVPRQPYQRSELCPF